MEQTVTTLAAEYVAPLVTNAGEVVRVGCSALIACTAP